MTVSRLPSLFISHGPPTLVIDDLPVTDFLRDLGRDLPRPEAILCISAHWTEAVVSISAADTPETIHDFFGFPDALYRIHYPVPGEPALAHRVAQLLQASGHDCRIDPDRGLDHGAWQPLMIAFPEADIPVLQLSLQAGADGAAHFSFGQALAPLREEGVLVVGSGTAVHNLGQWRRDPKTTPDWAQAFEDWLAGAVARGDDAAISSAEDWAADYRLAHPTDEHYLPLPVAMGAGSPDLQGEALHRSFAYGSLSMAAFAFGR